VIAVVAYGNPLRGDDGAAWRVAERLERGGDPIVVLTLHQLTPEVAALLSPVDGVIFVDASQGGRPGRVSRRTLSTRAAPAPLAHHLSPEAVLALLTGLYGTHPRAVLVTIGGEDFSLGENLSVPVQRAVPRAARLVRKLVGEWSLSALPQSTPLDPAQIPHA
jgi:hydrogenase maturation protease